MLVFAALFLGLVLGLQRRTSGGILAPIITHVTWSMILLFALPAAVLALTRRAAGEASAGRTNTCAKAPSRRI